MLVSFAEDLVWRVESDSLEGLVGLNALAKIMFITPRLLEIAPTSAMTGMFASPELVAVLNLLGSAPLIRLF